MSQLTLHAGGRLVTRAELEAAPLPAGTRTWHPVSHATVLDTVVGTLTAAGYTVGTQRLALAGNGTRFFGTLDLTTALDDAGGGVSLSVGVRNSHDKTFPLGFCAGNRVLVCDNLAFSAELMVRRKHTRFGGVRFVEAIAESVRGLAAFAAAESTRIRRLKEMELTEDRALALMVKSIEAEVIAAPTLPAVLTEYRKPTHDYGTGTHPTGWLLFNAYTTVLGPRATSNPADFAKRTLRLNQLLAA